MDRDITANSIRQPIELPPAVQRHDAPDGYRFLLRPRPYKTGLLPHLFYTLIFLAALAFVGRLIWVLLNSVPLTSTYLVKAIATLLPMLIALPLVFIGAYKSLLQNFGWLEVSSDNDRLSTGVRLGPFRSRQYIQLNELTGLRITQPTQHALEKQNAERIRIRPALATLTVTRQDVKPIIIAGDYPADWLIPLAYQLQKQHQTLPLVFDFVNEYGLKVAEASEHAEPEYESRLPPLPEGSELHCSETADQLEVRILKPKPTLSDFLRIGFGSVAASGALFGTGHVLTHYSKWNQDGFAWLCLLVFIGAGPGLFTMLVFLPLQRLLSEYRFIIKMEADEPHLLIYRHRFGRTSLTSIPGTNIKSVTLKDTEVQRNNQSEYELVIDQHKGKQLRLLHGRKTEDLVWLVEVLRRLMMPASI